MDHVTNIYAVLGKAYMHLGASAMFMSDLSKLLAAASVAAVLQQACLQLLFFVVENKQQQLL